VFLIRNKICRGVPPVSLSPSAPVPLVSMLPPPAIPRAALGRHGRARSHAIKRRPAAALCPKPTAHVRHRPSPCLTCPPDSRSPTPHRLATVSERRIAAVVQSRVPPLLLELAAFPHIAAPPHSLSSAAACSSCRPLHLSSIFSCSLPLSRACPSVADAGRLPHPRLRRLDVAGEDPSPCAMSSPRHLRTGVTSAC
jgi:hypothetical protein